MINYWEVYHGKSLYTKDIYNYPSPSQLSALNGGSRIYVAGDSYRMDTPYDKINHIRVRWRASDGSPGWIDNWVTMVNCETYNGGYFYRDINFNGASSSNPYYDIQFYVYGHQPSYPLIALCYGVSCYNPNKAWKRFVD